MSDETVRFSVLCAMFQAMVRDRSAAKKRRHLRTFLDRVFAARDRYFAALRLILPSLDRERGTYGLKESALAACLVDALGIAKDSEDALRLVNWRKGGARSGANAGNFSLVATEVLQRRQGMASGGLTIKELNDALDQLASKESRGEKASVLSDLIKKTNPIEMKWILMIMLKDLKLGISEKSIFHEFHPDAEDLFNVTCDLKLVCEKLKDRTQRHKRQDIEVGKAVRPQLAMRVSDAAIAWKKLHGKQVVVECKFDGDRIQVHKDGSEIHFFSRNFIDHSEYSHGMSSIIQQNVLIDRCILDGEMLVWDTSTNRFAEFGSNQEIAKAAREGLESDRQLCYVAFDILYAGDTSVIHQSLAERHALLQKVVRPVKGCLEILVPNGGLNDCRSSGEPCWSIVANCLEDVETFFKETIENRDEGIVLKDLGSKWEPSDRSGKWLKLKPDYIHAGADLDVLVIGGYFGSGRRGGEVAQFLMGLAERATPSSYPTRFISFCRVGTGLSDDELDFLVNKLKPYFRRNEYPKKAPRFYEVTYNAKERPDVWVESPDKSVILSITSDIRTIKSEVFAAPYSLRFPRIDHVRYDKPWHECLDVQSFVDLVHSSNGSMQRAEDHGIPQVNTSKNVKPSKKRERSSRLVPAHLMQTDVSGVKENTLIFANMMFYFVNVPSSYTVDYFHKLVAENGGTFSMNLNDSVTHCIAAEKKGIKYQAAMRHGDIIHYSWVLDCCAKKHLLHLQPKYFLFISESSKRKFEEEIDSFSDYYYWDVDLTDLKQIFGNMDGSRDLQLVRHYKNKYFPSKRWCLFQDCCIYLSEATPTMNVDHKAISELALWRMKLEVIWHGGEVSNDLSCATHLVVYSTSSSERLFDVIYDRFPSVKRYLLHNRRLIIVRHHWLEDSLDKNERLPEDAYNLRPDGLIDLKIEASAQDSEIPLAAEHVEKQRDNDPLAVEHVEKQRDKALCDGERGRKRGRPAKVSARKGRPVAKPARRTRARIGKRPAEVYVGESGDGASSDENIKINNAEASASHERQKNESMKEEYGIRGHFGDMYETASTKGAGIQDDKEEGYPETTRGTKPSVEEITLDERNLQGFHHVDCMEQEQTGTEEKLEIMCDPVQAMLLDMIPSLSQKKVETGKNVVEDRQQPESDINPVKKKVSYKDIAGQLLRDF